MSDTLITIIVAVFASGGFWAFLQTYIINRSRSKTAEQKLLLGLAFVQIVTKCEFYIARGWMAIDEYKELKKYLFDPYLEMGGNGTAKHLMEEVEKLPIKKEAV